MAKNLPTPIDDQYLDGATDDLGASDGGFVIDFAQVKGVEPLAPGLYEAVIKRAEPAHAKSSGNPMIKLQWAIDGGDHEGRIVFDNLVFATNALWRVREVLAAIGYPSNFSGAIEPESLIGEVATLQLDTVPIKREGNTIDPVTNEAYGLQNTVKKVFARGSVKTVDSVL